MNKASKASKPRAPRPKNNVKNKMKNSAKNKAIAAGKVRIIGGQLKRRTVDFIDSDGLRPTPDRLRETLFNWLLADIHGARVLDSCAGSGVLGFEALSRGAQHCTFIEYNALQSKKLHQSAEQLKLNSDTYQIIQGAAEQVLSPSLNSNVSSIITAPFDIVFIDPPYAQSLWQPILLPLIQGQLINDETLIYLEADKPLESELDELVVTINQTDYRTNGSKTSASQLGFECLKQSKVGQAVAGLYQLTSS